MNINNLRVAPLLIALVVAAACDTGADDLEPAGIFRPVEIRTIEPVKLRERRLPGRVVASTSTPLAFQVGGELRALPAREGALVEAGELLAEIDPTDYRLALRDAEARLARLATERERKAPLREEDILSGAAWEQLETEIELARVAVDVARRNLSHTRLLAPFDARVGRRLVDPFASVTVGDPVVVLQDVSNVDVVVNLASRMALELPLNDRLEATVRPAGREGPALSLAYHEHVTEADAATGTFRVPLRGTPEAPERWLPGMAVEVWLAASEPGRAAEQARVPLVALQAADDGGHFLWEVIDDDGRIARLPVEVARLQGEYALLDDPPPAETRIVAAGARFLLGGERVRPLAR